MNNKIRNLPLAGIVLSTLLAAPSANAALMFFTDRAAFEAASGLTGVTEDFEEANIAPGAVVATSEPLNAATNDGVFSTGDIDAGIAISTSGSGALVALGDGVFSPSKIVAADQFVETLNFDFSPSILAVGFDVYGFGASVNITIFDSLLNSLGSQSSAVGGQFFGVISDADAIGRINLNGESNSAEGADNITFRNTAIAAVPVPATLVMLSLGLFGVRRSRQAS